ncbi:MAG: fumarate hydratase C-terminal domain-containing protein, partial [Bacillota bacterium]
MKHKPVRITTPLTEAVARQLKAGDSVLISGVIYTGRDAAHKRMAEALDRGESLPVDFKNQIIYYVGPSPAKPGQVIGSAGPTTSGRMDAYTPRMLAQGLRGMIGKGYRTPEVVE